MNAVMRPGLRLVLLGLILVSVTPSRGEDARAVRIDRGRVDVTLSQPPNRIWLKAEIRTSFRLRNTSAELNSARRVFPVAAPPDGGFVTGPKPCVVKVNGKPVAAETKVLIDPEARSQEWPDETRPAAWSDRIEKWIKQDAKLHKLVTQYRKLSSSKSELNDVTREFQKRVKRHLAQDSTAVSVACGDPYFGHLVNLMPAIDPKLRFNGVSILNPHEYDYRPYEKEWRRKVDRWFAARPELAELLPKLRETWGAWREAQGLLDGPILKHLHDENGLSLTTCLEMKSYLEDGNSAPESLVRAILPDIRQLLDAEDRSEKKLLAKWGFDQSSVSPFTGKLLRTRDAPTQFDNFWRDPTVLRELGRPIPSRQPDDGDKTPIYLPALVRFDAPLKAGESAIVTLEHSFELLPMGSAINSAIFICDQRALAAVFPSADGVAVTVKCPDEVQPVIAPRPHSITVPKPCQRQFDVALNGDATMLHLVPVGIAKDPNAWLGQSARKDSQLVDALKVLIQKTKNPTVRPLQMSALYTTLLNDWSFWEAHQLALRITLEHPDFSPLLKSIQKEAEWVKEARRLHKWVLEKGKSPLLRKKRDLDQFQERPQNQTDAVTPKALSELARRVKLLNENELELEERMGRRFILCQAGVETQSNLAELLKLAEANPKSAIKSLRLIQSLTMEDKSAALPYVLSQIDLKLREKARAGKVTTTGFLWRRQNAAYYALSTFRSPKAAPRIIQFIHVANDDLLVQGATNALSHMTLPEKLDELADIADAVASSSESTFIQYLELPLRSDPDHKKVLPLLNSLRKKYPKLAPCVMRALGRAGHINELPRVLALYQTATDPEGGEIRAAVEVIAKLATPKDVGTLKYRRGLPKWMNERLVSIVRFQGGDSAVFPFVEAYYLEHVRGKAAHNHLTCVEAFAEIGDKRVIPYLREIFQTTERKRDAAEALGSLQLTRAIKRERGDNPFDLSLRNVANASTPDKIKVEAWQVLLADPEAAFRRAMQIHPLRRANEDLRLAWFVSDREQFAFISRFGDVAARQLLEASEGCSLQKRYRIAELLTFLLPDQRAIIEVDSKNESIDTDRMLTAQLALTLPRRGESTLDE